MATENAEDYKKYKRWAGGFFLAGVVLCGASFSVLRSYDRQFKSAYKTLMRNTDQATEQRIKEIDYQVLELARTENISITHNSTRFENYYCLDWTKREDVRKDQYCVVNISVLEKSLGEIDREARISAYVDNNATRAERIWQAYNEIRNELATSTIQKYKHQKKLEWDRYLANDRERGAEYLISLLMMDGGIFCLGAAGVAYRKQRKLKETIRLSDKNGST